MKISGLGDHMHVAARAPGTETVRGTLVPHQFKASATRARTSICDASLRDAATVSWTAPNIAFTASPHRKDLHP